MAQERKWTCFSFKASEINIFPKNHLHKLTSIFYCMNCGPCQLWNGNPEMRYIHLNQLRVYLILQALILLMLMHGGSAGLLWWFCPGLMAFVNQVWNFTNKAYWLIKNIRSISEATFLKENFRLFTLRKVLRRDWWFQSVYRIWGFF